MRSFARGLTGDIYLADDLVQNVCEKALLKRNQYNQGTKLQSWLFRITCTQWYDHLRRKKRRSDTLVHLKDYLNSTTNYQKNQSYNKSATIDLRNALKKLTDEQRTVLSLVTIAGYNYTEVAEILNMPVGTVASRVARARKKMAESLGEQQNSTKTRIKSSELGHEQTS